MSNSSDKQSSTPSYYEDELGVKHEIKRCKYVPRSPTGQPCGKPTLGDFCSQCLGMGQSKSKSSQNSRRV